VRRGYTQRQIEILTLMAKYGVLGSKIIQSLLKKPISSIRLRESLYGMEKRGLICRIAMGVGGSPMTYWMLPDEDSVKSHALKASGLDQKFFRNKRVRYSHIPHESFCTYVHASLERQMPTLWVYRESTAHFKSLPDHLLSEMAKESGYTPDLCIGVPKKNANSAHGQAGYRWIAVEVDRTNRSKKRIAQRLNIYTKHSAFSGLLYLMPSEAAMCSLTEIYSTRGGKDSFRLRGAANSFLSIGTVENKLFDVNDKPIYCGGFVLPLGTWLSLFSLSDAHERDRYFTEFSVPAMGKLLKDTEDDNDRK